MAIEENNAPAGAPGGSNTLEAEQMLKLKKRAEELEAQNADLSEAKRKYYDMLLNGSSQEDNGPVQRTVAEVRKELIEKQEKGCSNLEYASLVVELDEACIRENGDSCFLPKGHDVQVTADELMLAEKFPSILKECIKEADGNSEIFNSALQRRMRKK